MDLWAPYAQLDFAASSSQSVPNEVFEKRVASVAMELARQGRPFLLVMLDEAMRSIWRGYERSELLEIAREILDAVPANSTFASAEYALVEHILQTEATGVEVETHHLDEAIAGLNPFAAGTQALVRIRNDFANAFEATLYSAKLGNRFAPHEYVVQHYRRQQKDDAGAIDKLRALLVELAQQDDPVALLDLALASRADQDALLLSAASGNWQALWNVQNDNSFGLPGDIGDTCGCLQSHQVELGSVNAKLMQAALLSCWDNLGLGS